VAIPNVGFLGILGRRPERISRALLPRERDEECLRLRVTKNGGGNDSTQSKPPFVISFYRRTAASANRKF
jgi:hypothetical protein